MTNDCAIIAKRYDEKLIGIASVRFDIKCFNGESKCIDDAIVSKFISVMKSVSMLKMLD